MSTPLSYWKTLPGKEFMKIGIGALTRKSWMPYRFFKDYKIRPFSTEVKTYNNRVEFTQNNCSVGEYAYNYLKTVEIKDNSLTISYRLRNTGYKVIKTEEYCHNFLRPGDTDITGQFISETNSLLKSRKTVGKIKVHSKSISFKSDPEKVYFMYCKFKEKPKNFFWKITNRENGVSVKGIGDFPVSKFALWGMKHVISPETFNSIRINPGEEQVWSRSYFFEV